MVTLRTHSSSLAMSVSSSQGLTSSRIEDLAMRAGFLDFLAAYSARRCSLILAASSLSSSSSEPNRSKSSSLSLALLEGGDRLTCSYHQISFLWKPGGRPEPAEVHVAWGTCA
uniref:Uncharacterized protein n=1 Tax=Sphaeramia orbicularis TaxID=375764 RepID=A0A673A6W0_9TELE